MILKKTPRDVEARILVGRIHLPRGETSQAMTEFEQILREDSRLTPVHYQLALAHLRADNVQQTKVELREGLTAAPNHVEAALLLAELNLKTGATRVAVRGLEQLIVEQPGAADGYVLLSNAYLSQRDIPRALATAGRLVQRGDIPKARTAFEKVLALNPRFAPTANNLAWLYAEHGGDKDQPLSLAQTPKELATEDPRIPNTIGWVLYRHGVYPRALALLQESASKLPNNPQVQYHLGMVYAKQVDTERARRALVAAVKSREVLHGKDEAKGALTALR